MLALGPFQALLDAIGWVLAQIYDVVGNYGLAIVILTALFRLVLLPLGMKQIKSMQAMQAIQPRVKELQKKYKGNRQKIQEETMKLYQEAGVNPLGGCLPLLLQFPILIAMYAVLRPPQLEPVRADGQVSAYVVMNNHLPYDSALFHDTIEHTNTSILVANLQCSAAQAGTPAILSDTNRKPIVPGKPLERDDGGELAGLESKASLDCGSSWPAKIPYLVLLAVMLGTTWFQQRQMQKASPANAATSQQQQILKFLPFLFVIFGYAFPASLVVYWTVSNLWQIGQQAFLLRAGHIGPDALDRRIAEQKARAAAQKDQPAKRGFMARMMDRAEEERGRRGPGESGSTRSGGPKAGGSKSSGAKGGSKAGGTRSAGSAGSGKRSTSSGNPSRSGNPSSSARPSGSSNKRRRPKGGSGGSTQGKQGSSPESAPQEPGDGDDRT